MRQPQNFKLDLGEIKQGKHSSQYNPFLKTFLMSKSFYMHLVK
jgi:hypothetical protein